MAYLNVTAGTAREGGVSTAALDAGVLAASATGRALMATGLFDAATVASKFGTDSFTNAVVLQLIQDGALAASAAGRALMADNFFDATAVTAKFAANSLSTTNLEQLIADDAFAATAAIRALFATGLLDAATVDKLVATGAIGEDRLTAAELTGRALAVVANANVIGGVPVLHRIDVPAGTTGDVDTVLTHKTRICEAWLVKTAAAGGGAGTVQLKNGASAITDAMTIDIADQAIARALTIDDAQHEIAAAGTLRITRTRTASSDESCTVYVLGVRVA